MVTNSSLNQTQILNTQSLEAIFRAPGITSTGNRHDFDEQRVADYFLLWLVIDGDITMNGISIMKDNDFF